MEAGQLSFETRGIVNLRGALEVQGEFGPRDRIIQFPTAVRGIEVARTASILHFLHAGVPARGGGTNGAVWKNEEIIATYRVNYEDGQTASIPVRAGKDLSVYLRSRSSPPQSAWWVGDSPVAGNPFVCLYLHSWTNPRPEVPIKSIDVLSEEKEAALMLFGITIDPRDIVVPPTSEWRWLHPLNGADPAEGDPDFHDTFFRLEFDDHEWPTGQDSEGAEGGFGYGDERPELVDIGTPSEKPLGKSAYFRHHFTTTKKFTNLELRCQRDDGIIIYLDGKEVARDNVEDGEEAYLLPATSNVGQKMEETTVQIPLEGLILEPGEHVLSISLHNTEKPSSDLRIGGITLLGSHPESGE